MSEQTTLMAKRILARIEDENGDISDAFHMYSWMTRSDRKRELLPSEEPALCGTTLCAAGWAAHEDGWTLFAKTSMAERDGVRVSIEHAGALALDLPVVNRHDGYREHDVHTDYCAHMVDGPRLFQASNRVGLTILRRLAAGEEYVEIAQEYWGSDYQGRNGIEVADGS